MIIGGLDPEDRNLWKVSMPSCTILYFEITMDHGKYIIVNQMGLETPILFPSYIDHCEIAKNFQEVLSAGNFQVLGNAEDIQVSTFGKSTTLKMNSRERDAELIKRLLLGHY